MNVVVLRERKFPYLLSIILFVMLSCTQKKEIAENVLHLSTGVAITGLDPINSTSVASSVEIARVYEGLLAFHYLKRPYVLTPALAESMPIISKDNLTYTFKIRKGVFFHDSPAFSPSGKGRELVAEDFVYSLKRLADPKLQALNWSFFSDKLVGLNQWRDANAKRKKVDYSEKVEGLQATGKYTLTLKLTKPYPQFLYALAMSFSYVVPREAVEFFDKEFLNHPVGTGPYILPVLTRTNKIIYKRNPNYRENFYPSEASEELKKKGLLADAGKRLPFIDKIVIHVILEQSTTWLKFEKGKIDLTSIPKENYSSVVTPQKTLHEKFKKMGMKLHKDIPLNFYYIGINHDLKLFKNLDLRRALSMAYDRQKGNELFYNGNALLSQSVLPPNLKGFEPSLVNPYSTFNLSKAKKMLANAGYPEGKNLPVITYDCRIGTFPRQRAEFFKRQMKKIGVKVQVVQQSFSELLNKIKKRKVMVFEMGWLADYPDAENFLMLFYGPKRSPGPNGSGYDNPEFNRLYEIASVMQDTPKRTGLYERMNKMLAKEVPVIFNINQAAFVLSHPWVKNFSLGDFPYGREKYLRISKNKL